MESVLLVEYHLLLRNALKDLLARHGFGAVLTADNPVEAIKQIAQYAPQIIVLDTLIPKIEGFYLSEMLRALAPQSKIVLLIENTDAEYRAAAQSCGADAFIAKSALTQELPRILRQWQQHPIRE